VAALVLEQAVDDFPAEVALCRYTGEVALHAVTTACPHLFATRESSSQRGLAGRIDINLALINWACPASDCDLESPDGCATQPAVVR
jgi:hypothetical protein